MEKIGMIATEFTEYFRNFSESIEKISDNNLKIGYCRSENALDKKVNCTDLDWSNLKKIEMPERYQELLRNCDSFLCEAKNGSFLPELPLMSAKRTLICIDETLTEAELKNWINTAKKYHTEIGLLKIENKNTDNSAKLACDFFITGKSPIDITI